LALLHAKVINGLNNNIHSVPQ